jgi:tripartite-type tricarboxylate transporter receptor subunit TctC
MNRRSLLQVGALAAPALLLSRIARADEWPSRTVTIMVPFAPGGSSDIIGRAMAQRMGEALGKPVVVENRPGATGELGARLLARAAPDGYLLMAAPISTFAINKALRPSLGYDPVKDFTNLTQSVTTPNVLIANPKVPANNIQELIAWLKKDGVNASYSSSGVGASDHLTMELFKQLTDTSATHVPYSGGGPATTDLIAGNVQLSSQNLGFITPFIRDKQVKAIAVTAAERHPLLPDGIVASSPAEFAEFQQKEIARWTEVVRKGNIRAE